MPLRVLHKGTRTPIKLLCDKQNVACATRKLRRHHGAVENSLAGPQRVKHRVITVGAGDSTPRQYVLLKRTENICSHKNLYMNVHSSISHNSPKVETTQYPATDEKKKNVASSHNGILFIHKKE